MDALEANGVAAAFYNSSMGSAAARQALARLHAHELDLLYISPERLISDGFMEWLADINIALFAIDEAHCVSQWGHNFRREYAQLGLLRSHFTGIPIVALTVTADALERLGGATGWEALRGALPAFVADHEIRMVSWPGR